MWRTKHENAVYRNHDRAVKHFLPTFSQPFTGCFGTWNVVCRTTIGRLIQIRNHSETTAILYRCCCGCFSVRCFSYSWENIWTEIKGKRKSIKLKTGSCIELRSAQLRIGWSFLTIRIASSNNQPINWDVLSVYRDARILWTVVEWTSPTCLCFLVQNTPNDLQLLSDAPAHHIFCLLGPVDPSQTSLPEVYCVLQVRTHCIWSEEWSMRLLPVSWQTLPYRSSDAWVDYMGSRQLSQPLA